MNRWLAQNQLRSLDEAYRGALQIQELERQYFGGDRIAFRADLSKTVFDYVKTKRDRQLLRVRANLARFRLTSFLQNAEAAVETAAPTAQEQKILFFAFFSSFFSLSSPRWLYLHLDPARIPRSDDRVRLGAG